MPTRNRMELLAPAGDMDALRAAVQCGADAVYLGTGAFNARRRAGNFDGDALDAAVNYCHARGVKVHVTLNTLVREDEFDALLDAARAINRAGADAVIVQDVGVVRALRQIGPRLQLHASTQMAAHNRQAAAFLKRQGFDRVVLAREMTFEEMAECAREDVEIEAFAHGALCVACSGQCLMSSLMGGRSGNRGLCAQPCRLPWKLDCREGCLLSTKDLCALDDLARLRDAGVNSLKIEGRLKRAEYVAETVAAYRRALDALEAGEARDTEADRAALAQMFNRGGFTRGYGPGVREDELMYPERPNHIGVRVGDCRADGRVTLSADVLAADALVLRRGGEDAPVKLSGAAGETVKCPQARPGDGLFRLVSAAQMKRARDRFDGEHRQIPVTARATLRVGLPAALELSDGANVVRAQGDVVERATGRGFDPDRAAAQLKKTGGTPYAVADVALDADADAFCPASMLNALRRDALAALERARTAVENEKSLPLWGRCQPAGLTDEVADGQPSKSLPLWGRCQPTGLTEEVPDGQPPKSLPLWGRCQPAGLTDEVADGQPSKSLPLWGRCQAAELTDEVPDGQPSKSLPPRGRWLGEAGPEGVPLLLAQSSDLSQLAIALDCGADVAVYAPSDVRAEALVRVDLSPLPAKGRLALAVPAVLTAGALDALNAWALMHRDRFEATFLSNIGQLGLDWPGARAGDYLLNIANNAAAAQLAEWGMAMYTPSVELNAGQIRNLKGDTNLIVWGRLALMHLRHCPLRAAQGMKGKHADCRHCDSCAPSERLNGRALVDRKGTAFPLKRVAQDGGCVVQVLNSVPLMTLRRLERLPKTAAWRLLLEPDEPTEAIVKVYRTALDGGDFKSLPEWEIIEKMNTTTGHYFRGVE